MADGPLLVYGPRSRSYDFGPSHPLTPRRFGPGIDLLAAVGARPGLTPEPASQEDLRLVHEAPYLDAVRRLSADPDGPASAGIGPGDDPPFAGMHEAAATVAGGSLRAVEAILRGEATHAFHPGGGLHHAMPDRASGFCIYNDPALAIARARLAGRRVLYVDLDVHHGDGVQAIHADDPGVMTVSVHESGRYLFPGTGFLGELGRGRAAGTVVNVPLEPLTGEDAWLGAVRHLVPLLAASFGPDLVVSQHGADSHAWDPLAHLRVTTTAMGAAARIVDEVAHRWGTGDWLATGGGGYDAYRVVPRAWALTWLAGAHEPVPETIPGAWRARWAAEAERFGQSPLPTGFADVPGAGMAVDDGQRRADAAARAMAALTATIVVPALIREAVERGWWSVAGPAVTDATDVATARRDVIPAGTPAILGRLDRAVLEAIRPADRIIAALPGREVRVILRAAAAHQAIVVGAVVGDVLAGVAVLAPGVAALAPGRDRAAPPGDLGVADLPPAPEASFQLLALGVAPAQRGRGLGRALLARALAELPAGASVGAAVGVGERDPIDPLDVAERRAIAIRLLDGAGFALVAPPPRLAAVDPGLVYARRPAPAG